MLNSMGGFAIFGVSDRGEILGQKVSSKTIEDISNEMRKIEPRAFPDMAIPYLFGRSKPVQCMWLFFPQICRRSSVASGKAMFMMISKKPGI
jgi:hypothetical protein